jgi:hypothetical protein
MKLGPFVDLLLTSVSNNKHLAFLDRAHKLSANNKRPYFVNHAETTATINKSPKWANSLMKLASKNTEIYRIGFVDDCEAHN